MQNSKNEPIYDAKGSGHRVKIPLDESINLEHAILMRNLEAHQDTRDPYKKIVCEGWVKAVVISRIYMNVNGDKVRVNKISKEH